MSDTKIDLCAWDALSEQWTSRDSTQSRCASWVESFVGSDCTLLRAAKCAFEQGCLYEFRLTIDRLWNFESKRFRNTFLNNLDFVFSIARIGPHAVDQAKLLLRAWFHTLHALTGVADWENHFSAAARLFERAWPGLKLQVGAIEKSSFAKLSQCNDPTTWLERQIMEPSKKRKTPRVGHWLVRDLVGAVCSLDSERIGSVGPLPITIMLVSERDSQEQGHLCDFQFHAAEAPVTGVLPRPSRIGIRIFARDWLDSIQTAWDVVTAANGEKKRLGRIVEWWFANGPSDSALLMCPIFGPSAGGPIYCGFRAFIEGRKIKRDWVATGAIGAQLDDGTHELAEVRGVSAKLSEAKKQFGRQLSRIYLSWDQDLIEFEGVTPIPVTTCKSLEELYDCVVGDPTIEKAIEEQRKCRREMADRHLKDLNYLEPTLLLGQPTNDYFRQRSMLTSPAIQKSDLDVDDQRAHDVPDLWQDAEPLDPRALANLRASRICVLHDSGMGKTVLLVRLQQLLCADAPTLTTAWSLKEVDLVVVRLGSPEVPETANDTAMEREMKWPTTVDGYIERVAEELENYGHLGTPLQDQLESARALVKAGRVVFLCDALDQQRRQQIDAFEDFAGRFTSCRIYLTARPEAVTIEETLFDTVGKGVSSWRLVLLKPFGKVLQQQYLGSTLYEDLRRKMQMWSDRDMGLLEVPLLLWLLKTFPPDSMERFRNRCDVYAHAFTVLINRGLKKLPNKIDRDRLSSSSSLPLKLLAAVGFEMIRRRLWNYCVDNDLDEFRDQVLRAALNTAESAPVEVDIWHSLLQLNVFAHRSLFEVGEEVLAFRHRSFLEFAAANWLARFCREEDIPEIRTWIHDVNIDWGWMARYKQTEWSRFYWIWRFAVDLPIDDGRLLSRQRESWIRGMSALYDRGWPAMPDHLTCTAQKRWRSRARRPVRRASEFLYCTWDRMNRWAPDVVTNFQSEFADLLNGRCGKNTAEIHKLQSIARRLVSNFVPIPPNGMQGQKCYSFGWDEKEDVGRLPISVSIEPFRLSRFPVRNSEFELFAPEHESYRLRDPDPVGTENGENHPVVNVRYWDAVVFAEWIGKLDDHSNCRLPLQVEWEYACKAERSACDFRRMQASLTCYAHFGQDVETGSTVAVDDARFAANGFELKHMLGNVREWCADVFDFEFKWNLRKMLESRQLTTLSISEVREICDASIEEGKYLQPRVTRGGGWTADSRQCNASSITYYQADYHYKTIGFRLLRNHVI